MRTDQRVFHQTLDISEAVNDFRLGDAPFPYEVGQYLYIASLFPFNNLWFDIPSGGENTELPAKVTLEIWSGGNQWTPAVDVWDGTKGLSQSGRLQWSTDRTRGWASQYRSYEIFGLELTRIYDMYWVRLKWDKNLSANTKISYIGQVFSTDKDLEGYYPDLVLPQQMDSFKVGKTNWNDQHYMAAEQIIRDLKKRNLILSRSQLLDFSLFTDAACHKVAEIVYMAFGSPYLDQLKMARASYNEAINLKNFSVDRSGDALLDRLELGFSHSFARR